jgi:hypothetical protein
MVGEMPGWYPLVAAARYLKVPVWELENQSMIWIHRAAASMYAEGHARETKEKMASK